MVGFPNNQGKTPTKNDQHLGWRLGYHYFRKHPYRDYDKPVEWSLLNNQYNGK